MRRFLFGVSLFGVLLGAGGCSSTPTMAEPDEALRPKVEAWERQKSGDWSVRDLAKDSEIHDPDFVQHEIEGLSVTYPGHVPTLMACAIVAYDQKQPAKAQQYLDRVLALAPDHPDATILRARIALEDGNSGLARKLLEEEVRFRPDHAGVRETLAGVYFTLGRYDDARASLAVAERLGAPLWRAAFGRGLIEEATGHATLAASFYQKAIDGNPESRSARARLRALQASVPGEVVPPPIGQVNALSPADAPRNTKQ
jgi:tetratricopeptide (TPR) repeat protein